MVDNEELDDLPLADDEEEEIDLDLSLDDEEEEDEPEAPEEGKETPSADAEELARLRAEAVEIAAERDRLKAEKEALEIETENSNRVNLQNAITHWKKEVTDGENLLDSLQAKLEVARINGDADTVTTLVSQIRVKQREVDGWKSEITRYSPLLDAAPRKAKEVTPKDAPKKETMGEVLAGQWEEKNGWFHDPKFKEKKDKAISIFNQLVADEYKPDKMNFWNYLDEKLGEADQPAKRRTPPATRIASKGSSHVMTKKQNLDNEVKAATRAALERRGIDPSDKDYKRIATSYYNTYKKAKESGATYG